MMQLELKQVCKGYDHPVMDRLSLEVEQGEFFVIVGPSGIGKTTLLRCIAGLEVVDGGEIFIEGKNVTRVPPYLRKAAMTFESYALYPHMTVFDNIASPLQAVKNDPVMVRKRVNEIADLLKITPQLDRKPHEISGGQKQRTALGRTLAASPKVFLLDEPISHLDAKIRAELRLQFHTLEALREVCTVYVTHDYAEALSLGDRIGVMGNGGLVQIGTAHEIFEKPNSLFVAQHLGQPGINILQTELIKEKGQAFAACGQLKLPLHASHLQYLEQKNILKCNLGIRPQHLRVPGEDEKLQDQEFEMEGRVEVFEALGAYGVMEVQLEGEKITILTGSDDKFNSGDKITVRMQPKFFYYFNSQNGDNLLL